MLTADFARLRKGSRSWRRRALTALGARPGLALNPGMPLCAYRHSDGIAAAVTDLQRRIDATIGAGKKPPESGSSGS